MSPALRVVGVSKAYRRGRELVRALDGVDLELSASEVVALTGASGSGKSTLLNLVAGFDRPDTGEIHIGDFDVTRASERDLDGVRTRNIGFVFQQFHLVSGLTAEENVELALFNAGGARAERRRRARNALARFGLEDEARRRPDRLSGGQQQRVAVARALVGEPTLILADEPTAALDGANAARLLDEFFALSAERGVTIVISTHDPRCIERAHRVVTLEHGRLAS